MAQTIIPSHLRHRKSMSETIQAAMDVTGLTRVKADDVPRQLKMAVSAALYPIYGVIFICAHPFVWKRLLKNMGKYVTASMLCLLLLYTIGWSVQAAVMGAMLGPAAMQLLLAGEAVLLLYSLLGRMLSGSTDRARFFDEVLALRGAKEVTPISGDERAALEKDAGGLKAKKEAAVRNGTMVGWLMRLPLRLASSVAGHYYALATAPLLAVPFVGWTTYFALNGQAQGAEVHAHYFERKGVTDAGQQALIRSQRGGEYALFGCVAFLFTLVPLANYGLAYANVAGAAIWAADLEANPAKLYTSKGENDGTEMQQSKKHAA